MGGDAVADLTALTVKCLVWDLDNTLWRGTLLEDGEVDLPAEVRDVVVELDSRGILQSVASRNDHDLAARRLAALGVTEYFVVPHIGWGPKSESVRRIAERLRFAHHTIAFVDDQPAERAEVAFHLPDVRCYAAEQVTSLPGLPEFTPAVVTGDARRRREMYQASGRRDTAREEFTGPDEQFLRHLDMELRVERAADADLARVEELTMRTSQMNATGVHYSEDDLRSLLHAPDHEVLVASLRDRFGTHGAIGVVLLRTRPAVWHLRLLATSCRVVPYGAGSVILRWLVDQAARAGTHLAADFRRTERNRMMEVAYRFAGFTAERCPCLPAPDGDTVQVLHIAPRPQPPPAAMRLVAPDLATGTGDG